MVMRILISRLALYIFLAATLSSCKKDSKSNDPQVINVTVQANSNYTYDIGPLGDEEGISISRQPLHYQQSEIQRNSAKVSYFYKPALNFTGTDEVELRKATGSDGANPNNKITYTIIKFTVSN
jgi:hypothetical protein